MSARILGISAFYHDSAAALVVDGKVVAAAQEERFTRRKHDARFPQRAIEYCLSEAGIEASELDHVVFYEKPFLRFERLLETYLAVAPSGFGSFLKAIPQWIHQKLQLPREMDRGLGGRYGKRYVFAEHHESHAASAFYPSPFEEAAILTVDGVGEWATSSLGYGTSNRITLTQELRFPHSLGLLYSAFTYFCGFRVNSGEYKLMGLAPYGKPRYESQIRSKLIDLREDGSFRLDQSYFNYCQGLTMTSRRFDDLFGGPPRKPESELTQRELDLAASVQLVAEDVLLRMARHLSKETGSSNLCLAGGVALNCVANGRLLRESPFERIWIQPASGDAGGALGAALFTWHQLLGKPRRPSIPDSQSGSLLGPSLEAGEIESALKARGLAYRRIESPDVLCAEVAKLLAEGQVVGWAQGRMEFGPRALGSRSILGDARNPEMQRKMNLKIKFRESFRPFAPIVLREKASAFFSLKPEEDSPYMLIVAPVKEDQRRGGNAGAEGLDQIRNVRSTVPAVTHVDYSARIQTVDTERSPLLRRLLEEFERRTGCPMLVNTSFNIRGEPIVCTAEDAARCFLATEMDALVVGEFLLLKSEQGDVASDERSDYLARYGDD
ncbi:carbamoyltransferase [Pelagicoccus sp. SDUM812003]|uniref:carbamoyltransferase family protein n=1 Tax=Pelagicoccus sp. SDUM812003 TaxID=3041267 RepID=UPI00280DF69D|nr:carbamoyltransferase [Pelagicoccus sp. SDUM812003]MDQ8202622.1 carbamoyltransferase [Pelagicoccus sp. SDUM812003]